MLGREGLSGGEGKGCSVVESLFKRIEMSWKQIDRGFVWARERERERKRERERCSVCNTARMYISMMDGRCHDEYI